MKLVGIFGASIGGQEQGFPVGWFDVIAETTAPPAPPEPVTFIDVLLPKRVADALSGLPLHEILEESLLFDCGGISFDSAVGRWARGKVKGGLSLRDHFTGLEKELYHVPGVKIQLPLRAMAAADLDALASALGIPEEMYLAGLMGMLARRWESLRENYERWQRVRSKRR